jgi:hypothetical protein
VRRRDRPPLPAGLTAIRPLATVRGRLTPRDFRSFISSHTPAHFIDKYM